LSKVWIDVFICNYIKPLTTQPNSFLGSQTPHWSNK
jgi:hypothetical protein